MVILDMTNIVEFVNNINKRLNGLVNRVTKRGVRVNKKNKANNVKPSQADCEKEFDNNTKLKNTLQELTTSSSPNDRDKFKRAKACLAYKHTMKKNTSGAIIKPNNRNTVATKPGNNTKKNANAKGYYKVLGLNPPYNAISADALKKAYRKLALASHPNMQQKKGLTVNPEVFKKIQEAYEYLIDPDNRALYNGKKTQQSLTNEKQLLLKKNNVNAKHWTEYREKKKNSEEEEIWYVNKKNPISVWKDDLPKNAVIDTEAPDFWTTGESDDKSWFRLRDEYGHAIFYNKATGISSWEGPKDIEIKDLANERPTLRNNIKLPDPPQNSAK